MIQSFKCSDTEALHRRHRVTRWVNIEAAARRKLDQLHAAGELRDMAAPPGNRLQALSGKRKGQHSIRVDDQFRACFVWTLQDPKDVEIVDHHWGSLNMSKKLPPGSPWRTSARGVHGPIGAFQQCAGARA